MRRLEIRTRRMVNDSLAGAYHSVFKGRGMDFDEVREYVPGDEVTNHRLERHGARRPAVREEVHGGARAHDFFAGGYQRLGKFWIGRLEQARPRRGTRQCFGILRHSQ